MPVESTVAAEVKSTEVMLTRAANDLTKPHKGLFPSPCLLPVLVTSVSEPNREQGGEGEMFQQPPSMLEDRGR